MSFVVHSGLPVIILQLLGDFVTKKVFDVKYSSLMGRIKRCRSFAVLGVGA